MAYEQIVTVPSNAQSGQVPIADGQGGFAWGTPTTISTIAANISPSSWNNGSVTVNVTGVTASNAVIVSLAPASYEAAMDSGIYCSGQGNGTLTFTCLDDPPSETITMNVLIMN